MITIAATIIIAWFVFWFLGQIADMIPSHSGTTSEEYVRAAQRWVEERERCD